ncbi:MAG: hypothetical protein KKF52_01785 [Nanoarchaeota archaeon]|nr:hypothetical protein [Nanoarchaeota archaeon]MBU4241940.1 hypothetical protein [Nanoarchaeota archaeon]MBU4352329.1 hypothetical protein [Nanoarchaeota archaeon]
MQKTLFELNYGDLLNKMFSYSSDNLQEELTDALNHNIGYKRNKKIEPKDLDGYVELHTELKRNSFEELFGLRSTLFDIQLPEKNFEKVKKATNLDKWAGGAYYPKENFSDFDHDYLIFKKLGMAIEGPEVYSSYNHESLHAIRNIYSKNHSMLNKWNYKKYKREELLVKIEYALLDELLCQMATNKGKKEVIEDLKDLYLPSMRKEAYEAINSTREENKKIWGWSKDIKKRIIKVVEASYWLNIYFNQTTLVPLFLSFGPTISEISNKEFYSPFTDIIHLERDLYDREIEADEIREKIIEKGYGY